MTKRGIVTLFIALLAGCAGPQTAVTPSEQPTAKSDAKIDLKSGLSLAHMNHEIRPQDDLFAYANGAWLDKTEIPSDKSNYGAFIALADKVRDDVRAIIEETAAKKGAQGTNEQRISDLYASVMNVEKLEELGNQPFISYVGPIDDIANKRDLASTFGWMRGLGMWGPVGAYVTYDAKNPRRYLPHLTQSGLGLPDRDYYFTKGEREEEIRTKYKAHVAKMLVLSGMAKDAKTADVQMNAIYALETSLAAGHWTRVQRREREKRYNPVTRADLVARPGDFDWKAFLEAAKLSEPSDFIIGEPSYFDTFDKVFHDTPLATWKLYTKWKVVNALAGLMHKALDEQNFDFYSRTLAGTPEQKPRWERAVGSVNGMLGEAVGQVYVARHFKPEAKRRMVAMVEQLRSAYGEALRDLDWLSDETRAKAIEKLEKFRPKIGYPDTWKDYSALEIRADDLLGNSQRHSGWDWAQDVHRLGGPVDRDEWFMNPQTVNAYYNPPMNEIVFPAGILQPPFFNLEADEAVNYGAIGSVIGHEMGHGFDDQGAKSDGDGVLQNWWTEKDLAEFKSRTAKLVDQANAYTVLDDQHLNGEFTLGENIGDLGGLTIAVRAWKRSLEGKPSPKLDGFNGIQRFFLGWAQVWSRKYRDEELRRRLVLDPHAPSEFRANGPIQNIPEFIEAFGVKEGDKLYLPPEKRVKIW
jgi:putative endopeptidase